MSKLDVYSFETNKKSNKPQSVRAVFFLLSISLMGCSLESPNPSVEDLIKVQPPSFNNNAGSVISSPTVNYLLSGTCDPNAYATEYSLDKNNWTEISCVNGSIKIPVTVTGFIKVWARSKGKFKYSDISEVTIRYLMPPTSPSLVAVASSRSDSSDKVGQGTQNVLSQSFEGADLSNGSKRITTGLPRMVYEAY
ncbi:MAG: hypothetical protein ACXVCP_06085 [Bdellovibrio sp.]